MVALLFCPIHALSYKTQEYFKKCHHIPMHNWYNIFARWMQIGLWIVTCCHHQFLWWNARCTSHGQLQKNIITIDHNPNLPLDNSCTNDPVDNIDYTYKSVAVVRSLFRRYRVHVDSWNNKIRIKSNKTTYLVGWYFIVDTSLICSRRFSSLIFEKSTYKSTFCNCNKQIWWQPN